MSRWYVVQTGALVGWMSEVAARCPRSGPSLSLNQPSCCARAGSNQGFLKLAHRMFVKMP